MRDQTTNLKSNGKWASLGDIGHIQDQVIDTAKDYYGVIVESASKALAQANEQTSTFVRKYPVQCAAGALAAGFLVGAFTFRSRK